MTFPLAPPWTFELIFTPLRARILLFSKQTGRLSDPDCCTWHQVVSVCTTANRKSTKAHMALDGLITWQTERERTFSHARNRFPGVFYFVPTTPWIGCELLNSRFGLLPVHLKLGPTKSDSFRYRFVRSVRVLRNLFYLFNSRVTPVFSSMGI